MAEWKDAVGKPEYLALADFARHLIGKLSIGQTERFDSVFDVVELWHTRGEPYVREAATVGFLEALQNTNLHADTEPKDFEPWLRPESRRWWGKLETFWTTGAVLSDE